MRVSLCRSGGETAGYTRTIRAAGSNGIAAITWADAYAKRTLARSSGGRRSGVTFPRSAPIASPAIPSVVRANARPCCTGPTTVAGFEDISAPGTHYLSNAVNSRAGRPAPAPWRRSRADTPPCRSACRSSAPISRTPCRSGSPSCWSRRTAASCRRCFKPTAPPVVPTEAPKARSGGTFFQRSAAYRRKRSLVS